jgi:hypothetical protein
MASTLSRVRITRWLLIPLSMLTMFPSNPPEPCSGKRNPDLSKRFTTSTLDRLSVYTESDIWHKEGSWEDWASSTLKAEGTPPRTMAGNGETQSYDANLAWSCMYSVASLKDKKTNTAWSEAMDDDGIGQIALIPVKYFPRGKRKSATLKIFNGFGKSKTIWQNNNRIKEMVLHIASAKAGGVEYWTGYSSIEHKCKMPITLKDHFGYQTVTVPLNRPAFLAGLTGAITSDNKFYLLRARPLRWVVCSATPRQRCPAPAGLWACIGGLGQALRAHFCL